MSDEDVANQMHDEVENYIRETFTDCYVDTNVEEIGTAKAKYEFVFGRKRYMFNNISFTANPTSSSDAIVLFLANPSEWVKEYVEKMLKEQEGSTFADRYPSTDTKNRNLPNTKKRQARI